MHLDFDSRADAAEWVQAWGPLAAYCRAHEPHCYAYEAAIDDGEGKKVVIMERYADKKDLKEVHETSAPFLAFRQHDV